MKQLALSLGAALCLMGQPAFAQSPSNAPTLGVGDAAPKLQLQEFVKGAPLSGFEKGRTYVVEFWATWCGPCRTSIPHLSELARKNKDVTFLGVSVWENDPAAVKPFVAKMGNQMDYLVATDVVPKDAPRNEGRMSETWMRAAAQDGIPAAFIINGEGKVAWIGHPMAMDKPLEQIRKGEWDLAKAAARDKEEAAARLARRNKILATNKRLADAEKSGGVPGVLKEIEAMIAEDPSAEATLSYRKLEILIRPGGDADQAAELGRFLVDKLYVDNANYLSSLANTLVVYRRTAEPLDARLVKVALDAALRADQLQDGRSAPTANALAKAYFLSGQKAKAVEAQERAVKLVEGLEDGPAARYKAALEEYRKAAAGP